MAQKKFNTSMAVEDLGLGSQTQQQVQDIDAIRRKKKVMAAATSPGQYQTPTSAAAAMLYGKALI